MTKLFFKNFKNFKILKTHTLLFVTFAAIFFAGSSANAEVRVGINGYYKSGCWTRVVIDNIDDNQLTAPLKIVAPDSDGVDVVFPVAGGEINAARESYVKLGRAHGTLKICFAESEIESFAGTPPRDFPLPIPNERPIYLVVGGGETGITDAVALLRLPEHRRPVIVRIENMSELPQQARGYDAISLVVLTSSPEAFGTLKANSPQIQALHEWVTLGGKLVLFAGRDAGKLLENFGNDNENKSEDDNAPLAPFFPGRYERMTTLRQSEPLTLLAGSSRPLLMTGSEETPFIRLPHLVAPRGIVLAQEADLVIASRSALGMGTITYCGGDFDAAPLKTWRDRPALLLRLLGWNDSRQTATTPQTLMQLGYNDVSGQMRSALDAFWQCGLPFSVILIVMILYLVVIGVGDYFLVHKFFRCPSLTWITFPASVTLFAILAQWLDVVPHNAFEIVKSTKMRHIELYDFDTVSRAMRLTQWSTAFAPRDALYRITMDKSAFARVLFAENDKNSHADFCWLGLTGSGLGGMNPKTITPRIWQRSYACENTYCLDVPMAVRSTKPFLGTRSGFAADDFARARFGRDDLSPEISLTEEQGIPIGTLTNPFPFAVRQPILLYGRWVITLARDLQAGETVKITSQLARCEPRELLYQQNFLNVGEVREITAAQSSRGVQYNPQSRNFAYILRTLGFYQWLGGYENIGLYNEHQHALDLSEILRTDRAVLFGSADEISSGAKLENTKDTANITFVRAIFPVRIPERVAAAEATQSGDILRAPDPTRAAPDIEKPE